jgi:uncharacterized protein
MKSSYAFASNIAQLTLRRYTYVTKGSPMRLRLCLVILSASLSTALPMVGAVVQPVVRDAVPDLYRPLAFDQQRLSGLLANRMRANVEGYLEHAISHDVDQQNVGEYLEAAANTFDYTHDRNLGTAMEKAVKIALQQRPADPAQSRSYLLGLLSYYRVTANQAAFAESQKLGNAILDAPADAGMLEPMIFLYKFTGDRRYLDYCRKLVESVSAQGIESAPDPANVSKELSGLLGLAEFYRITGDSDYLKTITGTWRQIHDSRLTATGTLAGAGGQPAAECVTLAWMQLTLQLFRLTGLPQYGDELERTTYNQLLAGQDGRSGTIFTTVPLNGAKEAKPIDDCRNSVARGVSLIPALIWGRYGRGLAVNFYSAGSATVMLRHSRDMRLSHRTVPRLYRGNVRLYEEANFPESGDVLLHVEPDYAFRFPVRLRVPSWTDSFVVSIGGTNVTGKPGQYLVLNRKWKRGDTVKITMSLPLKLVNATPSDTPQIALRRGPQVLSLSKVLNPDLQDLSAITMPASRAPLSLKIANSPTPLPTAWSGDQAYQIEGFYQRPLVMVPFADARDYRTSFPVQP